MKAVESAPGVAECAPGAAVVARAVPTEPVSKHGQWSSQQWQCLQKKSIPQWRPSLPADALPIHLHASSASMTSSMCVIDFCTAERRDEQHMRQPQLTHTQ